MITPMSTGLINIIEGPKDLKNYQKKKRTIFVGFNEKWLFIFEISLTRDRRYHQKHFFI